MAPRCGCGSSSVCGCRIVAGENVTVTGSGSVGNPFIISSTGDDCYTPRMTRAQALALRTSSLLVVGCPVVITDGPTIGVAGHTSSTEIELQPVSATEIGLGALVNTTFDNSAWTGLYDIDVGSGSIVQLEDNDGNIVSDPGDGGLVHTQFPWGFPGVVQSNRVLAALSTETITLTGWGAAATAGTLIRNNDILGGGHDILVDLTGFSTAGFFVDNVIRDGHVVFSTPLAAGSTFSSNIVRDGYRILVAPTGAAGVIQIDGCEFYDRADASVVNDMEITISGGTATLDACRFRIVSAAVTVQHQIGGSAGAILMQGSFLNGSSLIRGAAAGSDLLIRNSEITNAILTLNGTVGTVSIASTYMLGGLVTRDAAAVGAFAISDSYLSGSAVLQNAGATAGFLEISFCQITGDVTQAGPGVIQVQGCYVLGGIITNTPTATRGLRILRCTLNSSGFEQRRTLNANLDSVENCNFGASTLIIDGAAGIVGTTAVAQACDVSAGSLITITNPSIALQFYGSQVSGNCGLTIVAGGEFNYSRLGSGAILNTGAFILSNVIVEGLFTKTATANNTNTLTNKSYDDLV